MSTRPTIPFVDLRAQIEALRPELDAAWARVTGGGWFILGSELEAFERELAAYCGVEHAIGVASGTDALELALRACGIGPGDEVVTVAHTFAATALAVTAVGATPVFVDVDPATDTMDPQAAGAAITARTRALLPVHLYGRLADVDALASLAREHGLRLIEDACQAHGARLGGRAAGSFGDAACFSFYPSKNLGAFGDGGAVVTADAELAERLRLLRNYAQPRKYHHVEYGRNSRLDELQAAILRVKIAHLDGWNAARRALAGAYGELLADVDGLELPSPPAEPEAHVYHLYVVRCAQRERLRARLAERGIGTEVHYPIPVHLQPLYGGRPGELPVTERHAAEVLSLPMYPELTAERVAQVCEVVRELMG